MNTYVEGTYATVEDALRAVDTLIMRGHDADSITLISNRSHHEEQLETVDITVKKKAYLTERDKDHLGKHMEDLEDGRFVVQITKNNSEDKKQSEDVAPLTSENGSVTEDAEILEDVRNSDMGPGSNRTNSEIGYSSDLKTPEETPLDNGPNRSL